MKLKPIKPGMVIYCKTPEEMGAVIKHIDNKRMVDSMQMAKEMYRCYDCIRVKEGRTFTCGNLNLFGRRGNEIIEFSDLVIQELSAEEVWNTLGKIDDKVLFSYLEELEGDRTREEIICEAAWDKLVDLVIWWKSVDEKKEPEWFWFAEVHGTNFDSTRNCESEEEAKIFVEQEVKKCADAYGKYERVCRVKGA